MIEFNLNHYTPYEPPQIFFSFIPRLIEIWDERQYFRIRFYCKPDLFEVDIIADIRLPSPCMKFAIAESILAFFLNTLKCHFRMVLTDTFPCWIFRIMVDGCCIVSGLKSCSSSMKLAGKKMANVCFVCFVNGSVLMYAVSPALSIFEVVPKRSPNFGTP